MRSSSWLSCVSVAVLFSNQLAEATVLRGHIDQAHDVVRPPAKLVWLLGSSLDKNALEWACPGGLPEKANNSCIINGMTFVWTFLPPFRPLDGIVRGDLGMLQQRFGKVPDATIVDLSLWDVKDWWEKAGKPTDWPVPHKEVNQWCHDTIPNFLPVVQEMMPHCHVAFRSQPPVYATHWDGLWFMGKGDKVVEEMYQCVKKEAKDVSVTGTIFGKYSFIDYYKIVAEYPGDRRKLYKDDLHPGREMSLAYMAEAEKWANAAIQR